MIAHKRARLLLLISMASVAAPHAAAQTDEIQVYDASIADVGKFNYSRDLNCQRQDVVFQAQEARAVARIRPHSV